MREEIGKLLLRLTIGGLMLFHGIDKAIHGVSFIEGLLTEHDLPAVVTYGVYIGEIIAPLLLIFGVATTLGAITIIVNMLMAILLVYSDTIFSVTPQGAWSIEVPMLYLMGSVVILLLGPGKYSVDYHLFEKTH